MPGIIKADGTNRRLHGVQSVPFNFEDVKSKAGAYLETVRAQAAQIIAEANEQAESIRRRAQEQGRQAAMEAAQQTLRAELSERLETLLPALDQSVLSIEQSRHAWLKHWEQSAVRLAVAIAGRIARRQIEQTPEVTLELIREALELAAGSSTVKLYLNPRDHETLGAQAEQLARQISNVATVQIVPDPEITAGGCLVKTEFGQIDQRLETQLKRIEEELT